MDLTKILVNVDKGTKLYSPLFKEPLTFLYIDFSKHLPIRCMTKEGIVIGFSKEGYYADIPSSLTCVLFPTPEMTWDNIIYVKGGKYYINVKGTVNDLKEFKKVLTKYNYCLEGYSINEKEPKKFDFDSFTEFDKVLVRDSDIQLWRGDFFQYKKEDVFICTGSRWHFCIPYNDDTKHLVGTTMPAPEYYR